MSYMQVPRGVRYAPGGNQHNAKHCTPQGIDLSNRTMHYAMHVCCSGVQEIEFIMVDEQNIQHRTVTRHYPHNCEYRVMIYKGRFLDEEFDNYSAWEGYKTLELERGSGIQTGYFSRDFLKTTGYIKDNDNANIDATFEGRYIIGCREHTVWAIAISRDESNTAGGGETRQNAQFLGSVVGESRFKLPYIDPYGPTRVPPHPNSAAASSTESD